MRQKLRFSGAAKAQRTLPREVLNAEQIIPGMQRSGHPAFVLGGQGFAAFHQHLAPAIRRGVIENPEVAEFRGGMKGPLAERKIRVQGETRRMLKPSGIVRKTYRAPIMGQCPHAQSFRHEVGIDPDVE